MEQLAHYRLYDTKAYSNSYKRRIQIYTSNGSPIQQIIKRKRVVLSNNKKQIYGLRGMHIIIPASLFHGPKLPPGNPGLLVDGHEEPT